MENEVLQNTENKKRNSFLKYFIVIVVFAAICVGLLIKYATTMNKVAEGTLLEMENKAVDFKPLNELGKPISFNNPELFLLYKEKVYKESLIAQSKADSMGLIINLKDSSLTLAISGIPVFSTKVKSINISKPIASLSPKAYLYYFGKPFVVDSFTASFEKEPIVKREAPKDTLEAANFFAKPDTSLNYRVTSHYYLKPTVGLTIEQVLTDSVVDRKYIVNGKINHFFDSFKKVMTGKEPEYQNNIVLYVSATDAMVIYRALPQKANIVIYPY